MSFTPEEKVESLNSTSSLTVEKIDSCDPQDNGLSSAISSEITPSCTISAEEIVGTGASSSVQQASNSAIGILVIQDQVASHHGTIYEKKVRVLFQIFGSLQQAVSLFPGCFFNKYTSVPKRL